MMSARKARWPMSDQLARDAAAALAAGLTYGKYMAIKENRDPVHDEPLPGEEKLICEKCGQPFFRANKRLVKKCKACREGRTLYRKVCPFCGKEFTCKNGQRIYCDQTCKEKSDGKRWREKMLKERGSNIQNCAKCGKEFESINRRIYCSEECRVKVAAERSHKQWEDRLAMRDAICK